MSGGEWGSATRPAPSLEPLAWFSLREELGDLGPCPLHAWHTCSVFLPGEAGGTPWSWKQVLCTLQGPSPAAQRGAPAGQHPG